ncbi:hypothetical protein OF83DRAFT_1154725 [Amylostereum chailletii]|nr:hypothetical protein OF83DRAFT_1154725 [Amylostereum chailletii]
MRKADAMVNRLESYIRLEYVLAGAYGWEVLTNIRYDWGILAKKRMSWTPLVYLICRFSGVVTFVLALSGLNARSGINCNVWVVFLFVSARSLPYAGGYSSSNLRQVFWVCNNILCVHTHRSPRVSSNMAQEENIDIFDSVFSLS